MSLVRYWLPVLIWIAVILSASSPRFSATETAHWIEQLFGRDLPQAVNFALRKLGHVTGYGILGALAFRATAHRAAIADWSRRNAAFAVAIAFLIASIDEWNQSRIPTRTGTAWDVLLDVCAAIVVVAAIAAAGGARRRRVVR